MVRAEKVETCVFCDRPVRPDEPGVGQGETAAHAACADAALRDESSWDRIAAALGEDEVVPDSDAGSAVARPAGPGTSPAPGPGAGGGAVRSGCAMIAALLLFSVSVARIVRRDRDGARRGER